MKHFKCDVCKRDYGDKIKSCVVTIDDKIDANNCVDDGLDDAIWEQITKEEFLKEIG